MEDEGNLLRAFKEGAQSARDEVATQLEPAHAPTASREDVLALLEFASGGGTGAASGTATALPEGEMATSKRRARRIAAVFQDRATAPGPAAFGPGARASAQTQPASGGSNGAAPPPAGPALGAAAPEDARTTSEPYALPFKRRRQAATPLMFTMVKSVPLGEIHLADRPPLDLAEVNELFKGGDSKSAGELSAAVAAELMGEHHDVARTVCSHARVDAIQTWSMAGYPSCDGRRTRTYRPSVDRHAPGYRENRDSDLVMRLRFDPSGEGSWAVESCILPRVAARQK
jgi:hypothetical protein